MGQKAKAPSVDQGQASSSQNGSSNGNTGSAFTQLTFAEVLEDLSSRFIVNLPSEELASIERICFQVEQA
jgi:mRNA-decapping enzyme subunit 2